MGGHRIPLDRFVSLGKAASRHHRSQIAGLVALTAHTRRGEPFFRRGDTEVPVREVHRTLQADARLRRMVYNLWMTYMR